MSTKAKENEKSKRGHRYQRNWFRHIGIVLFSGAVCIFSCVATISMAAPENPEIEAMMEEKKAGEQEVLSETDPAPSSGSKNYEALMVKDEKSSIPLIVIDPGHGGEDDGCLGDGVFEKDINLQIALLVKERLEEKGFRVMLPRETDEYLAKEERVELANSYQADAYISIHQNTYEGSDKSVSGIETWYDGSDNTRDNQRLASLIHKETIKSTGANERELWPIADFCVTGKTLMPACLIETGFLSNPEECKRLTDKEYQNKVAEGIAQGVDLYFHPKTMYLTFDDGPSKEYTEQILDVLKEKDVKATFFLIGEYVEKYPQVAKRIADEGHTIGIHCYRHDYDILYESVESYLEDFWKAYDAVLVATGVEAELFRFPGGSVNAYNKDTCADIVKEMTAQGFIYFDWNASLDDTVKNPGPAQILANAAASTLDRKKVVMLAHDRVENTALCLGDLIDQFPEYQIKPLNAKIEPVHFRLPAHPGANSEN
ncbi:MAG: N-acetylmuramoyl-L-alanine amidase [Lachnospiraceae bacterium]|nr:N-acetylmuramoyl-L-alanine amidase [Lachnospiraceae bacterium]